MPSDIIKRSFLKCGISNAMDGSEDDALFEDRVGSVDTAANADDSSDDEENDDDDNVYMDNVISQEEI